MVEVRRVFEITDFDPESQKEIPEKLGDVYVEMDSAELAKQ